MKSLKNTIIIFFLIVVFCTGCSRHTEKYSFSSSDYSSPIINSCDINGKDFVMTKFDISLSPQLVIDFVQANGTEYSVVTSTDKYVILSQNAYIGDNLSLSYYKLDVKTGDYKLLYTPQNWSFAFDPIPLKSKLALVIIKEGSETNDLAYDIVSIDLNNNETTVLCSGKSYYYPIISSTGDDLSILSFKKEGSSIMQDLSYYDFERNKLQNVTTEPLQINPDFSVSGYELYKTYQSDEDIIIDVSFYEHENRQEGLNGNHILYRYSIAQKVFSSLDFQPGYLCNYAIAVGNSYLIDREDTGIGLSQSGYFYENTGSGFNRWKIPNITPASSIKDAYQINENLIFIRLKTGAMIVNTANMSYWYKESFAITYSDGFIYYSENNKVYSISIKDIFN